KNVGYTRKLFFLPPSHHPPLSFPGLVERNVLDKKRIIVKHKTVLLRWNFYVASILPRIVSLVCDETAAACGVVSLFGRDDKQTAQLQSLRVLCGYRGAELATVWPDTYRDLERCLTKTSGTLVALQLCGVPTAFTSTLSSVTRLACIPNGLQEMRLDQA